MNDRTESERWLRFMASSFRTLWVRPVPVRIIVCCCLPALLLLELAWLFVLGERCDILTNTQSGLSELTVRERMGRPSGVFAAQSGRKWGRGETSPGEPIGAGERVLLYSVVAHRAYVYIGEGGRVRCTVVEQKPFVPF